MKTKKFFSKLLILSVALLSVLSFSGCGIIPEQEAIDVIEAYLNDKYSETHKVVVIEHVSTGTQFGVPFSDEHWYEAIVTKLNSNEFFTAECNDNGEITGDTYYQLLFEDTLTIDVKEIFSKHDYLTLNHLAIEWSPSLEEWNSKSQYEKCIKSTVPEIIADISMKEENPLDKVDDFHELVKALESKGVTCRFAISNSFNQKTEQTYMNDKNPTVDDVRRYFEFLVIDENSQFISTPDTAKSIN